MFGFLQKVDDENSLEKYTSQLNYFEQRVEVGMVTAMQSLRRIIKIV